MNPDVFAEWLRGQGHRVHRTASSYWFDQGPRVYQAFPYHYIISPPEAELTAFLRSVGGIGLRYSTPVESSEGHISYHAVYEQPRYEVEQLGKWARKNVRRGLRNCVVEQISFTRLATEGWKLQADTLDRQGRELHLEEETWRARCLAADKLEGFEAWGALVEGRLASSVITFRMNDYVYMLYQQCLREHLPQHVNNALSFTVTKTMVERPGVKGILYGLHSLDAPSSVDEFKFRMGYSAKPVRQRAYFHPLARPLFNPATHALLKQGLKIRAGDPVLAKAEGLVRFYLAGKLPLDQQEWPQILRGRPEEAVEE